jgi:L-alanine-DL-glutamate epimerase-like enolase superfamily enzyme
MDATLSRAGKGPNNIAMAAIDVACWDAYARERGEVLGIALGGAPREIPVYGSGQYNASLTPAQAVEVTKAHVRAGFKGVKPRVDASRSAAELLRAVRDAAPPMVDLMCDINEKSTASQAHRLMTVARDSGYVFVEEPIPTDDLAGYRSLARAFPRFAAVGEHLQGVKQALPFLAEGICGVIQPDLAMIGGLTPALELSRVANAYGVEVSPHFLAGLFVHLGYACPNMTWLEDFPLLEPLFNGWPTVAAGKIMAADTSGHGLSLAEAALEHFQWCR